MPRKSGSKKVVLTPAESQFAKLVAEHGLGSIEAARKAFNWRCEKGTPEEARAKYLIKTSRIRDEVARISRELKAKEDVKALVQGADSVGLDNLRAYVFKQLELIRDDETQNSTTRLNAISTLEKLHNPAQDINLAFKYLDLLWRTKKVHCPCCHATYPMEEIENKQLNTFREKYDIEKAPLFKDDYDRKMELYKRADRRRVPHPDQQIALKSPERHIVGTSAARAGKSWMMALFALEAFLIPGTETWILAEQYESARSEVEYLERFLTSIFYPYIEDMIDKLEDRKTGEITFISKWGSELKIRSSKSKGSITGRALELALVAEPGWVPGDIYNHLRARVTERLGRIIAFGTPQGTQGFLGRMVKLTGRDPKTNRIARRSIEERLIKNGSPWSTSMLVYKLNPESNPEYVSSELDSAMQEMTADEYATEFGGEMREIGGKKFYAVTAKNLKMLNRDFFERASFGLGIDQGPRNFGACLVAYDGDIVVPCFEFFNYDETTMRTNLVTLRKAVPLWIRSLGGDPTRWKVTITDQDPPLTGDFSEMEDRGVPWPTEIFTRPRNNPSLHENWRRETQEWVNNAAIKNKLIFHKMYEEIHTDYDQIPGCELLHDQVFDCGDVLLDNERESKSDNKKGWIVSDPVRKDHILDAWLLMMWLVSMEYLEVHKENIIKHEDPWFEQKAALEYSLASSEAAELGKYSKDTYSVAESEMFEEHFKRSRKTSPLFLPMGNYKDES